MANGKHIAFLILIPFIVWASYFTLKNFIRFTPVSSQTPRSVDEETVMKYIKLKKELNEYKDIAPDTSILEEILNVKKEEKKLNAKTIRPIKKTASWNLKYIIITKNKKVAFLNGKIVKIGDKINGALIVDIKKECILTKTKKGLKCIYLKY